ncbi:MAG: hemolysin III family protein [Gammaproteobacteria bacterium]|nr:hemolysin III family protein [Gammaproteobacteria bacterium]
MNILSIPGFSEPMSSLTHLLAAVLALVGGYFLLRRGHGNSLRVFSLLLYTFALIFLFSMSGVYHLLDPEGGPRQVLQRLDHAAIWILIAGTFTPIHMILFRGAWRWGVLLLVWFIAITGLILEIIFFKQIAEWLSLSFYLGLGWIGIATSWHFRRSFAHTSIRWLWLGGLFYSLGGFLELLRWPVLIDGVFTAHELFHLFVIAGAWAHWVFTFRWAHYPTSRDIQFQVKVFPNGRHVAKAIGENLKIEAESLEQLRLQTKQKIPQCFASFTPEAIHLKFIHVETLSP